MAKKRYDVNKNLQDAKGFDWRFTVGRLSMDLPALSKTNTGKYVSPVFRTDKDTKSLLANWFTKDGTASGLVTLKDGSETEWKQDEIKGKIMKKVLSLASQRGDETNWYPLELWENIAKFTHMYCSKGDLVATFMRKKETPSTTGGNPEIVWVVDQLQKITGGGKWDLEKNLTDADGANWKFVVGRLSMDLPALSKTPTGKYVSPSFRTDKDTKSLLSNWFTKDGIPTPLYTLKDGTEKDWKQDSVENNFQKKTISVAVQRGEKTNWYPLEMWENIAKFVHRYCSKGDLVALVLKEKVIEIDGRDPEKIWVVNQLQKLMSKKTDEEKAKEKSEAVEKPKDLADVDNVPQIEEDSDSDSTGFYPLEDDDLPF